MNMDGVGFVIGIIGHLTNRNFGTVAISHALQFITPYNYLSPALSSPAVRLPRADVSLPLISSFVPVSQPQQPSTSSKIPIFIN